MSDLRSFSASKSLSLADLTTWVNQNEEALGPLVKIGKKAGETIGTFDMAQSPPTKAAKVKLAGGAEPTNIVCTGPAYVTGQVRDVVVYRG